jgi:hypothetical protein
VARLMREQGLAARPKRAFRPRTTRAGGEVGAPNRIKGLALSGPDQIWVSASLTSPRGKGGLPGGNPGPIQPPGGGAAALPSVSVRNRHRPVCCPLSTKSCRPSAAPWGLARPRVQALSLIVEV